MKSTESDVCYFEVDAVFNREPVELLEESTWTAGLRRTGNGRPANRTAGVLRYVAMTAFIRKIQNKIRMRVIAIGASTPARDLSDASPPTLEIMGTKCISVPNNFCNYFSLFFAAHRGKLNLRARQREK